MDKPFRIVPLSRIPPPNLDPRLQLLELLNHPYFKDWLEQNSPEVFTNLVSDVFKYQVGSHEGGGSLLGGRVE